MMSIFIDSMMNMETQVRIYLINGVKLEGFIKSYDADGIILERGDYSQLVRFDAVATIGQADDDETKIPNSSSRISLYSKKPTT